MTLPAVSPGLLFYFRLCGRFVTSQLGSERLASCDVRAMAYVRCHHCAVTSRPHRRPGETAGSVSAVVALSVGGLIIYFIYYYIRAVAS